jgi:hypothetical protein
MVTATTVGYGDRVPKTKLSRLIAMIWMIAGIIITSLLQAYVVGRLTSSTTDLVLRQIEQGIDNLFGLYVGVLPSSLEELRIRARGARVVILNSIEDGIQRLERGELDALAVDMLAAGVISNTLSDASNIEPSSALSEQAEYGFLLSPTAAALNVMLPFGNGSQSSSLYQCLQMVGSGGTEQLNMLTYFRGYVDMAFDGNFAIQQRREQQSELDQSQIVAAIVLPLLAVAACILGYVISKVYDPATVPLHQLMNDNSIQNFLHDRRLADLEEVQGGDRPDGTVTKARLRDLQSTVPTRFPQELFLGEEDNSTTETEIDEERIRRAQRRLEQKLARESAR